MKLAEALVQRADIKKRLTEIQTRLAQNARVQDGETPHENPETILRELAEALSAYRTLIQRINRTNAATQLSDGRTITDAIAERDVLLIEQRTLDALIKAASQVDFRYSRTEIKLVATVNVAEQRRTLDAVAKTLRELDLAIQRINWEVDVLE
ncbi:MAG: DIP1984 family protein [Chloroflexi bacterium]|nr:DIP1984 family protein [Chloroflexota bacterium]